eukprot:CAMPEP_0174295394 /NCGR_PEP_ID=MMETSP0809-20121228/44616_1 /TAXON_ID=73025 ORGANISM="Eutreptiella gymnastica-like, Strain CCMP1594" /NCGR_SAMPLE_ID=MMETSP0809 /ASSEMBLY_ACC=CAM_ASM_000658 /LENGTH=84 /DNA_ID=CAMNT_0015397641 /DNA_START=103 /DNA_END=358 /DNA_ORIENTATION=-
MGLTGVIATVAMEGTAPVSNFSFAEIVVARAKVQEALQCKLTYKYHPTTPFGDPIHKNEWGRWVHNPRAHSLLAHVRQQASLSI